MAGRQKSDWLKAAGVRMTHGKYRANLDGINIFFGAILGVVMSDIGDVSALVFALVLTMVASFVITIIYITSSDRRLYYALYALGALIMLWFLVARFGIEMRLDVEHFQDRILPTLLVWVLLTILIEFAPRTPPTPEQ